jgi:alpha-tubulin suppressor-like RCC1 family protein
LIGVRIAAAGVLAWLATGCMDPGDFRCTQHAQCAIDGDDGFCEVNGHCSVADRQGCPLSLRRYAHRSGSDSDACVPTSCEANPIVEVSAGGGHACLRREDGGVWCWGRNDRGQLGDSTRTPRAFPVRVDGVSNAVAIAAGDAHTCAAQSGGPVVCWGGNDTGQLGDGGPNDHALPQPVPGVMNASALAAGKDFSCAATTNAVYCWGDDSAGQLGDGGAVASRLPPSVVAGLSGVTALSGRWQHVCAVHGAGKLTCWGANTSGQIGDGIPGGPHLPVEIFPPPATVVVTAVVTGNDHTCALASDGLRCWGSNAQGQIDPSLSNAPIPNPLSLENRIDPLKVTAGAQHTCIVDSGASVTCWGSNASDQLGAPAAVKNAAAVYAGAAFSCALAADGAIYCWGDNHFGQLAIGGDVIRTTPAQVPGLAHVTALAAGGAHNCATADDASGVRALFCWGANGSGQLGDGSAIDAPEATRISALEATGLAAGARHTCAYPAADRELRCWGSGGLGQLALYPGVDGVITVPTVADLAPPAGGDGLFAVAAGASHTCVGATISASVLCFGLNTSGQLGNGVRGSQPDYWAPVPSLQAKAKTLAGGAAHSCALDEGGAVWCWGLGAEGQLGDDTGLDRLTPAAVALGSGTKADALAAGANHTCALAGGKVLCWGRNAEGQLGAPLPQPLLAPTAVPELQARAVAAGERHTCAIEVDATVSCWGANESGQLGNGEVGSSNIPVPVVGLTSVDAIVAGGAHSCARRSDGTVWCWGANTSGQLGVGGALASARPLLARISCE